MLRHQRQMHNGVSQAYPAEGVPPPPPPPPQQAGSHSQEVPQGHGMTVLYHPFSMMISGPTGTLFVFSVCLIQYLFIYVPRQLTNETITLICVLFFILFQHVERQRL